MVALDIAKQAVDLSDKTILPLSFAMDRDPAKRKRGHKDMANAILQHLRKGRDVAMVNLGDVTLYASAGYLSVPIRQAGYDTLFIPGVTSVSAASAALGLPLAEGDSPVHFIPSLSENWKETLSLPGAKVLMKPGKRLPEIYQHLKENDWLSRTALVLNCGLPGEQLHCPLTALPDQESYYTLVIVKE